MEHNDIIGWMPWPVAVATAIWFGLMAHKAAKNRAVWVVGGGILGLVVTTIVMGLGQAMFVPFYTNEVAGFRIKVAGLAIVLVLGLGWLFTGSLHQQARAMSKRPEEPAPVAQDKAPAPIPKP